MLSEIIATEPFIVAGTSLNEIDLEYYLSFRSDFTPRKGSGPSLLVEPFPDVVTESDCKRYGLELVPHTFEDFLLWLRKEFPSPPKVFDLTVPDYSGLFDKSVKPTQLLKLFSEAEVVTYGEMAKPTAPPAFLYGRKPDWKDLNCHIDIPRVDTPSIIQLVRASFDSTAADRDRLILIIDNAGSGKSTIIKRAAHDLVKTGVPVLSVRTLSRINSQNMINCLKQSLSRIVLVVDSFAEHVDQVLEILEDDEASKSIVVLAADRDYRQEYIDLVLGAHSRRTLGLNRLSVFERQQLIGLYTKYGLVGDPSALRVPMKFVRKLERDPIAIAICRILNDFKPLDDIVLTLWNAASPENRFLYLAVALAEYCCSSIGLKYSQLQALVGPRSGVSSLFEPSNPLRVTTNPVDPEFIVALNPVIAERALFLAAETEPPLMQEVFRKIATVLAPFVNRQAIMMRTPEARISGRLFDSDKIVRPLLGKASEAFYKAVQTPWEWNSRYWEQRALLVSFHDIDSAVQYARHAVGIERHPYPLTTLGKLLFLKIDRDPSAGSRLFPEAMRALATAISLESQWRRMTVHPFNTLFMGVAKYLENGGSLLSSDIERIEAYLKTAETLFSHEPLVRTAVGRVKSALKT